jgi:hypothetical protein
MHPLAVIDQSLAIPMTLIAAAGITLLAATVKAWLDDSPRNR